MDIPNDIFLNIGLSLSYRDRCNLFSVCKRINNDESLINSVNHILIKRSSNLELLFKLSVYNKNYSLCKAIILDDNFYYVCSFCEHIISFMIQFKFNNDEINKICDLLINAIINNKIKLSPSIDKNYLVLYAYKNGYVDKLKYLINHKLFNFDYYYSKMDKELIKLIIEQNIKISFRNYEIILSSFIEKGDMEMVKLIIDTSAINLDESDFLYMKNKGIIYAINHKQINILKYFFNEKLYIIENLNTYLSKACSSNNLEILMLIIELYNNTDNNIKLIEQDEFIKTIEKGNFEIFKVLCEYIEDISIINNKAIIQYAACRGNKKIFKMY
jgi:hypothetical protein